MPGASQLFCAARHSRRVTRARVCASSAQRCEYEPFVGIYRRRATLGEESREKNLKFFYFFFNNEKAVYIYLLAIRPEGA